MVALALSRNVSPLPSTTISPPFESVVPNWQLMRVTFVRFFVMVMRRPLR